MVQNIKISIFVKSTQAHLQDKDAKSVYYWNYFRTKLALHRRIYHYASDQEATKANGGHIANLRKRG
jgi:formaldehyde-activating enzyme involved in methanogenesis